MLRDPNAAREPFNFGPLERFAVGLKLLEILGDQRDSSDGAGTWVGTVLGLGRRLFPDLPPVYRVTDLESRLAECRDSVAVTFRDRREAYDIWKALAADYLGQDFDRHAAIARLLPAGFEVADYRDARRRIEGRLERLQAGIW
jgi:hypothetical protein